MSAYGHLQQLGFSFDVISFTPGCDAFNKPFGFGRMVFYDIIFRVKGAVTNVIKLRTNSLNMI